MSNPMQMIMQLLNSGRDPQQLIQMLMQQNPNAGAMLNQMRQSGMSPKQFAKQYFLQNNMDFAQFEQLARNRGIKS